MKFSGFFGLKFSVVFSDWDFLSSKTLYEFSRIEISFNFFPLYSFSKPFVKQSTCWEKNFFLKKNIISVGNLKNRDLKYKTIRFP